MITPRISLESIVQQAVAAAPCYVLFSGGRDSSALLAVATAVARRTGAPEPIPVTEVYRDIPESDESQWQRLVLEHLGLRDWLRVEISDENDLLGPIAREGLRSRGLVWPPALQIKPTVLRRLGGGSVLTGDGGDEVLGPRRGAPVRRLLTGRPTPRSFRSAAGSAAPAGLRRKRLEHHLERSNLQPWLHEDVRRDHYRMVARDLASEPLAWNRSVWWLQRRRHSAAMVSNYQLLAQEFDLSLSAPFLDYTFLAALSSAGGPLGYPSRTEALRELVGDLLPRPIIERTTKATFNRAYVGRDSREFARTWDGSGVDESVDPERLREEWLSDVPSAISTVLLQSAWLNVSTGERQAATPA